MSEEDYAEALKWWVLERARLGIEQHVSRERYTTVVVEACST